ncbi:MAG: Rrf2 family transcriptional regulator [Bacteroidales bacterium]|nr:Rrf2 family transcriptional regulator [Bacteroidales bacterium]MCF8389685.1 Rrf2 family transcriptional regulator [Bacteroidales bacterium]
MISTTSKYAIRSVIYLAVNNDKTKTGIKKISKELDIPAPFLSKILQTLAKHRILSSTKGPNGGFSLGIDSKEIHLMDIVQIIEGLDSFEKCAIGVKYCKEQENKCALHKQYSSLREEMKKLFKSTNIYDLALEIEQNKVSLFI